MNRLSFLLNQILISSYPAQGGGGHTLSTSNSRVYSRSRNSNEVDDKLERQQRLA